ncbi:GTP-binding protein TrmE/Glycine cleavage system T protein, domain 1 [Ostreococcus tauri]|uniref:Aminomethyltransferase n=1 Tax=Ostreococcus tauri TaxID=70448 RepID=Q00ZP0_OSTTA|nr:GTP-binding protein TrmE/Glycine cleavage system T protein, domain 1 [Ostreococcus tauri]CAL56242.1 GTP-binding protein TrmE/Glycine cleavage system T protein, domain 1 [Ostreococcus tauri]|eukprot:XP_003081717.1 GTP-binding protein TrmE/Glycine cleavage system T protein, domain 1 [Ostreococcus tauri]
MRRFVVDAARRHARCAVARPSSARAVRALVPDVTPAYARAYADVSALKRTPLYDVHVARGGKLVDFAGYALPIQYGDSIMEATQHCRTNASLFDVSHMLGSSIRGKDATAFLESLVVADLKGLKNGTGTLSVMTNEKGGIIDDTVITKINDHDYYVVLNAGCAEKDQKHINAHLAKAKANGMDVDFIVHSNRSLLAFQGPKTMEVLQRFTDFDLSKLYFGMFTEMTVNGGKVWVTRTGYTGEDGFEISVPNEDAVKLAEALEGQPEVRFAALGPRDSLRLEAGLCLYGNDLNEDITPPEAGLTWTIGKARREKCDFVGGEIIKKQLENPASIPQRRVGLTFTGKGAPARQHSIILDMDGNTIGEVTSGGFSPVLQKNIAMGYVAKAFAKAGTEVQVETRGKRTAAVTSKMPFVNTTYYKPE